MSVDVDARKLMNGLRAGAFLVLPLLLGGCEDCKCENGFKVKTAYKYSSFPDFWHESPSDTFLDGAVRVSTSTHKDGRSATVRCFRLKPDAPAATLDLRYTLRVPLLKRISPELEKAEDIELVVTVDGTPVGNLKARAISHDFGISFLGGMDRSLLDKIGEAKKAVVVMPRRGTERLDDVIEFGVADLSKHIQPVKHACAASPGKTQPEPNIESKKT